MLESSMSSSSCCLTTSMSLLSPTQYLLSLSRPPPLSLLLSPLSLHSFPPLSLFSLLLSSSSSCCLLLFPSSPPLLSPPLFLLPKILTLQIMVRCWWWSQQQWGAAPCWWSSRCSCSSQEGELHVCLCLPSGSVCGSRGLLCVCLWF